MPSRPLRAAISMLSAGLALTVLMAWNFPGTAPHRSTEPEVADADPAPNVVRRRHPQSLPTGVATPPSQPEGGRDLPVPDPLALAFELDAQPESEPDTPLPEPPPAPSIVTVLDDGPASHMPARLISRRRGYEELPPPPELHVAALDEHRPTEKSESLSVGSEIIPTTDTRVSNADLPDRTADPLAAPLKQLAEEMARLREDVQSLKAQPAEAADNPTRQPAEPAKVSLDNSLTELLSRFEDDLSQLTRRQSELEEAVTRPTESSPKQPATESRVSLRPLDTDARVWEARFDRASPEQVIAALAQAGAGNLVLGQGVHGEITLSMTASLKSVTRAVMDSLGCGIVDEADYRLVLPQARAAQLSRSRVRMQAKVVRTRFRSAESLLPLIRTLLTPGLGEAVLAGGDADSGTLLVVDHADPIRQIEALIREVDLPPAQFRIEGSITLVRRTQDSPQRLLPALCARGLCRPSASGSRSCDYLDTGLTPAGTTPGFLDSLGRFGDVHVQSTPSLRVLDRQCGTVSCGTPVGATLAPRGGLLHRYEATQPQSIVSHLSVTPTQIDASHVRLHVQVLLHELHGHCACVHGSDAAVLETEVIVPLGCGAVIAHTSLQADDHLTSSKWWQIGRRHSDRSGWTDVVIVLTPHRIDDHSPQPTSGSDPLKSIEPGEVELLPAPPADDILDDGVPPAPASDIPPAPAARLDDHGKLPLLSRPPR